MSRGMVVPLRLRPVGLFLVGNFLIIGLGQSEKRLIGCFFDIEKLMFIYFLLKMLIILSFYWFPKNEKEVRHKNSELCHLVL